jgi:hypothetical protein
MALGSTQPLAEMSTRKRGQGGRCVGLTTLPPTCADCLKILEPQPSGTLKACNRIALPLHLVGYSVTKEIPVSRLIITYIFDMVLHENYNHIHKVFFPIFTNIQYKHYVLETKSFRPCFITWAWKHFFRNVVLC